jgi:ParB-like chromosome segregation protein Spo0J
MNEQPQVKTLSLKSIKPYWRNPRDNREAVEKVKKSIEEYGYNQFIAVDRSHVIIAGHTRFLALQALGWKKAPVMVLDLDEKKAKAYRIIDNKTNEFATWTAEQRRRRKLPGSFSGKAAS